MTHTLQFKYSPMPTHTTGSCSSLKLMDIISNYYTQIENQRSVTSLLHTGHIIKHYSMFYGIPFKSKLMIIILHDQEDNERELL